MAVIKTFLIELLNSFPFPFTSVESNSKAVFTLKKQKRIQYIIVLVSIVTAIFFILNFTTLSLTVKDRIQVGDSPITHFIVNKEMHQNISQKPIQHKEELQKLAIDSPLSFSFYRISPGENLSSIAEKFGLSMATVLSLNSLDNAHSLSVGQKILLSTRSGIIHNTTNLDTVSNIATRYGISAEETKLVNNLTREDIPAGTTLFLPNANLTLKAMAELLGFQFINPVPGYRRISSHFGWRRHPILKQRILHRGIDFAAPIGTPIVAPKEGRVTFSGWYGSFGLTIIIRHNNGFSTLYAHQSKLFVKEGQWVSTGQRIGSVGNTGRSTGPHLHFELRKYGQAKNPVFNGLQL